jgi:Tfp pilus assembly protein PilZ
VPFAAACDVTVGGERQRAMLCNLSIVGAYVHTERPPELNREIELAFDLPDGGPTISIGATVTWVNDGPIDASPSMPRGFGARFLTASPDDVRRIADLVADFLSDPDRQYQLGVGMPPSGKPRIPFVAPCTFVGEQGELAGSLCNLSALGAYVAVDRLPDLGVHGRVRFSVPGIAGDFEVEAVVRWHNSASARVKPALPPGCGLEFEALSPIDHAILATVVEAYLGAMAQELRPPSPGAPVLLN